MGLALDVPHSAPTVRRWLAPAATVGALASAVAYTYIRNPFEPGAFPACIFYAGTGLYCPGCGGLRAVHSLLHGDVLAALNLNALAILVTVPLALVAMGWWLGATAGLPWKAPRYRASVVWILVAVVTVFTVLRNIPAFAPYLAP